MYLLSINKNIINTNSLIYSVPMEYWNLSYSVNVPLYLSIMLQVISINTTSCQLRDSRKISGGRLWIIMHVDEKIREDFVIDSVSM